MICSNCGREPETRHLRFVWDREGWRRWFPRWFWVEEDEPASIHLSATPGGSFGVATFNFCSMQCKNRWDGRRQAAEESGSVNAQVETLKALHAAMDLRVPPELRTDYPVGRVIAGGRENVAMQREIWDLRRRETLRLNQELNQARDASHDTHRYSVA